MGLHVEWAPPDEPLHEGVEEALGDALDEAFELESGEADDGELDATAPGGREERPRIRPRGRRDRSTG
jgi:hypothetical protein